MLRRALKGESRSEAQIVEHYEIEVSLARQLKEASEEQRIQGRLYTKVYDELFRRVSHHPQLQRTEDIDAEQRAVAWQISFIGRFLSKEKVFLEIGAGDCALSFSACDISKFVYGLDVSHVITDSVAKPTNFKLILSDGVNIPLENESVDVIYSNQLMEHIHPDDAFAQLEEISRVLVDGGKYICITPNRANGPWDISYYFDDTANGFHLNEYTASELVKAFNQVGLKKCRAYAGARKLYFRIPVHLVMALEKIIMKLPTHLRLSLGRSLPIRTILGVRIVGIK